MFCTLLSNHMSVLHEYGSGTVVVVEVVVVVVWLTVVDVVVTVVVESEPPPPPHPVSKTAHPSVRAAIANRELCAFSVIVS